MIDVSAVFAMPCCERCGAPATIAYSSSYRDEEYAARYFCAPCDDKVGESVWQEGVAYVDAQAAKIASILPHEG